MCCLVEVESRKGEVLGEVFIGRKKGGQDLEDQYSIFSSDLAPGASELSEEGLV